MLSIIGIILGIFGGSCIVAIALGEISDAMTKFSK